MAYDSALISLHVVAETPRFLKDVAEAGLGEPERQGIVDLVAANPMAGDEVVGSGGVRKLRVAGRGKGKSGGYRVMVAYLGEDAPVYLLALLGKGDRASFSRAEVAAMRTMVSAIRKHWKERPK